LNFLIDTHILLWWLADHPSLSSKARKLISNENNLIFVSMASIWEMIIKKAIGKLKTPDNIDNVLKENDFKELPIKLEHVIAVGHLPNYHKDPFDRMLLAQAKCETLTLITSDEKLTIYEISHVKV
jgi:PIN domain nuclease of toxin-antitoxin system